MVNERLIVPSSKEKAQNIPLVENADGRVCRLMAFVSWPFELVVENQWAHATEMHHDPVQCHHTKGTIFAWPDLLKGRDSDCQLVSETTDPNWVVITEFYDQHEPGSTISGIRDLRQGLYVPRVPGARTVQVGLNASEDTCFLGYKEVQTDRTTALIYPDKESRGLLCTKESGKWEFWQTNYGQWGESPEWFENPEYYQRRGARKKFNRDILIEYCERIGLDITNPELYHGRIAIIGPNQEKR